MDQEPVALVSIEVSRQDYATCRQPVPGIGHCNALVGLYQTCVACSARRAGRLGSPISGIGSA